MLMVRKRFSGPAPLLLDDPQPFAHSLERLDGAVEVPSLVRGRKLYANTRFAPRDDRIGEPDDVDTFTE